MSSTRLVHSVVVMLAALVAWCWAGSSSSCLAEPPQAPAGGKPERGLFYVIEEPITHESVANLRTAVLDYLRQASRENREPSLVFQFGGDPAKAGTSDFYPCSELSELISNAFRSAQTTIAYVPDSLSGYALIPVLACDEIVLGQGASLGPITPENNTVPINPVAPTVVDMLARAKTRDIALLRGMVNPGDDLREVRLTDGRVVFVLASDLPEYARTHEVAGNDEPAWGGQRGVLAPDRARSLDLAKLLVRTRDEIERHYGIELEKGDPSRSGPPTALEIVVNGTIDSTKADHIKRQVGQVVRDKLDGARESMVTLVILRIDSAGGEPEQAKEAAEAVAGLSESGVHTVAFIESQATGFAALLALACDEIVLRQNARIGDVSLVVSGQGTTTGIDPAKVGIYADEARDLARRKLHPELLAAAMVDPKLEVVAAQDNQSNALVYITRDDLNAAPPGRYAFRATLKPPNKTLLLLEQKARETGIAEETATDFKTWLDSRGVKKLRTAQPTWVDSLVEALNTQWMSGMLLFIGLFMLILELKLPGVGLPAIISALAFLLFFWSHYLGHTANTLEIVLFLAGLVCIGLELFVFPGFAVFGFSGVLMVLVSVIMACHTFIWPTTEYEFRELGWTITKLAMTIVAVGVGAAVLGKFLPSVPMFRHMILNPEAADASDGLAGKPLQVDSTGPLTYLLGERGLTTTVCRPSGKARFGEQLVDITADGFFIESGTAVEVVEVRGSQVIVKRV